jgi:hypothetical protein
VHKNFLIHFFIEKQQPAARGHQQKQEEMEVDEEEEDGQEENEAEKEEAGEGNEEDKEGEAEDQDELVEEGGGGGEEDDDIIVIEDGNNMIKVKPKLEVKQEGSFEMEKTIEIPLQNEATPGVETAKEKLQKVQAKAYYEWMAGIKLNQIETTIKDLDTDSVLEMVRIADQEIRQHPEKFICIIKYLIIIISILSNSFTLQICCVASLGRICHQEMHVQDRRGKH